MCPRKQAHFALWDAESGSVYVQSVHKVLRIGTPPKCCCKRRGKCLYLYYTNQQTRYNTPLRTLCRATKGVTCMDKQSRTYQAYVQILKEELIPAMGCTEPIAIAYAAAKRGMCLAACRTKSRSA